MEQKTIKRKIYDALCDAAAGGLTCGEIEETVGIKHSNATGRIVELRKSGHAVISPTKRLSAKGRPVNVYLAVDFANGTETKGNE